MVCIIIMQPIIDSTNILMLITLKTNVIATSDSENEVTESHMYIHYVWIVVGYLELNILLFLYVRIFLFQIFIT